MRLPAALIGGGRGVGDVNERDSDIALCTSSGHLVHRVRADHQTICTPAASTCWAASTIAA